MLILKGHNVDIRDKVPLLLQPFSLYNFPIRMAELRCITLLAQAIQKQFVRFTKNRRLARIRLLL